MVATRTTCFTDTVDDGSLTFELIRLPGTRTVGVGRTLTTEVCSHEQHLVFASREEFAVWMSADDYRHQVQALLARVQRRFDELLDAEEGRHGTAP